MAPTTALDHEHTASRQGSHSPCCAASERQAGGPSSRPHSRAGTPSSRRCPPHHSTAVQDCLFPWCDQTGNWERPLSYPRTGSLRGSRDTGQPPQQVQLKGTEQPLLFPCAREGCSARPGRGGSEPQSHPLETDTNATEMQRGGAGHCTWHCLSPRGRWLANPSRLAVWPQPECCSSLVPHQGSVKRPGPGTW